MDPEARNPAGRGAHPDDVCGDAPCGKAKPVGASGSPSLDTAVAKIGSQDFKKARKGAARRSERAGAKGITPANSAAGGPSGGAGGSSHNGSTGDFFGDNRDLNG